RLLSCRNPTLLGTGIEQSMISTEAIHESQSVNIVKTLENTINAINMSNKAWRQPAKKTIMFCDRCGSKNHKSNNPNCSAIGNRCMSYTKLGNFQAVCKDSNKFSKVNSIEIIDNTDNCAEKFSNVVLTIYCNTVEGVRSVK
ncbi:hypothetical protein NDU88_002142, partial [Pleurodeles waltl]